MSFRLVSVAVVLKVRSRRVLVAQVVLCVVEDTLDVDRRLLRGDGFATST